MTNAFAIGADGRTEIDVTIVMPCLNEAEWLPNCIANAKEALALVQRDLGLTGEILVADNGSDDGSQLIARALGTRVVDVEDRGYGAALLGGLRSASGKYLVMGDADGSYDFRESVAMVRELRAGADLCIGSRFKGDIEPGAMPWKNRYLGNPILTFVLNLFFRTGVSDAHCGLRALTSSCFDRLNLTGGGMEFASEMIIKATLQDQRIVEVPVTLSRDLRNRPPHLRPWRDGWRHLRYLLMLSPWAFAASAAFAATLTLGIWTVAAFEALLRPGTVSPIGNYWVIFAGALLGLSHTSLLLSASIHFYGRGRGYRLSSYWELKLAKWMSLEAMLIGGAVAFSAGIAVLACVLVYWSRHHFTAIANVLPAVVGTTLTVIGAQNALGGFLLAVISGNETEYVRQKSKEAEYLSQARAPAPVATIAAERRHVAVD
jgi:glycosyltransferase involved in cell wall biosynthesis